MPNWCDNILVVSGAEASIISFRQIAHGFEHSYNEDIPSGDWGAFDDIRIKVLFSLPPDLTVKSQLSFHALYPVPDEVLRLPYSYSAASMVSKLLGEQSFCCGYEWETNNWGVKWGAVNVVISSGYSAKGHSEAITYEFSTAWGPPNLWLKKVAKDWPMLNFNLEYVEPGMNLSGELNYEKGRNIQDG